MKREQVIEFAVTLVKPETTTINPKYWPEFFPSITYESGGSSKVGLSLSLSQAKELKKSIDDYLESGWSEK